MEGLAIGERDCLDDGLLSLYVAQHPTRLGLLRFAIDALRGKLGSERDFDVFEAAELEIETHRARLHVATDGEVTMMDAPLRYRVRPGALTVLVPQATMETRKTTTETEDHAHTRSSL
jgi:diacylglycerol kinase family enzyme